VRGIIFIDNVIAAISCPLKTILLVLVLAHSFCSFFRAVFFAQSVSRSRFRAVGFAQSLSRTRFRALVFAHSFSRTRFCSMISIGENMLPCLPFFMAAFWALRSRLSFLVQRRSQLYSITTTFKMRYTDILVALFAIASSTMGCQLPRLSILVGTDRFFELSTARNHKIDLSIYTQTRQSRHNLIKNMKSKS
jgi:hypothetical protein